MIFLLLCTLENTIISFLCGIQLGRNQMESCPSCKLCQEKYTTKTENSVVKPDSSIVYSEMLMGRISPGLMQNEKFSMNGSIALDAVAEDSFIFPHTVGCEYTGHKYHCCDAVVAKDTLKIVNVSMRNSYNSWNFLAPLTRW